jgi:hypothetical protein
MAEGERPQPPPQPQSQLSPPLPPRCEAMPWDPMPLTSESEALGGSLTAADFFPRAVKREAAAGRAATPTPTLVAGLEQQQQQQQQQLQRSRQITPPSVATATTLAPAAPVSRVLQSPSLSPPSGPLAQEPHWEQLQPQQLASLAEAAAAVSPPSPAPVHHQQRMQAQQQLSSLAAAAAAVAPPSPAPLQQHQQHQHQQTVSLRASMTKTTTTATAAGAISPHSPPQQQAQQQAQQLLRKEEAQWGELERMALSALQRLPTLA